MIYASRENFNALDAAYSDAEDLWTIACEDFRDGKISAAERDKAEAACFAAQGAMLSCLDACIAAGTIPESEFEHCE